MLQLPKPPRPNLQKPKKPHERLFVDSICKTLEEKGVQYQREVSTPVGYIDVLTDETLYEAKHWSNIKHAVGQILFYGHYYPRANNVIVAIATSESINFFIVNLSVFNGMYDCFAIQLLLFNLCCKTRLSNHACKYYFSSRFSRTR